MAGGSAELWLLATGAALGTYACRGLGVLLSGRIGVDSELFRWVACVAYAMIAGLVARIIIMPAGIMADTTLPDRLLACVLGLAVYRLSRHNLLAGVASGALVLIGTGLLRGS